MFSGDMVGQLANNKNVVIHCRMGIGRSATIAAAILIWAGVHPDQAFDMLTKSRGQAVPDTVEQKMWVYRLAEAHKQAPVLYQHDKSPKVNESPP